MSEFGPPQQSPDNMSSFVHLHMHMPVVTLHVPRDSPEQACGIDEQRAVWLSHASLLSWTRTLSKAQGPDT